MDSQCTKSQPPGAAVSTTITETVLPVKPNESALDADAQNLTAAFPHGDGRGKAAANAVAGAFARIVAGRYPGTSWRPVELGRSEDSLVAPTGKVIWLFP